MYDNREVIVVASTDTPGGELIDGMYEKYGSTQRVLSLLSKRFTPLTHVPLCSCYNHLTNSAPESFAVFLR
jgi:hypothetical protein